VDALPAREVGEIAVRGDTVMLGYWRRPDLTAQALCDGWLRTGDLGWMDDQGYVHLTDRKKDMIITGGENVYSSEVEVVLCEHDAVAEAVVIGVPDEQWGERVHAIVVARESVTLDVDAVQAFCRGRLAGYKVPKGIELRDSVPRLPTGKIAKAALRDEYWQGHAARVHGA
jgi:acyl-CoA synthetase (AMP-forming)/AMP-acid ligase II